MRTRRCRFHVATLILAVAAVLASAAPLGAAGPPKSRSDREIDADARFAGDMATRGLWREALFRWERVLQDRPDDARILNNVAVAAEALGLFDKAKEAYEKALALTKDHKIASNYELFRRRLAGKPASPPAGQ